MKLAILLALTLIFASCGRKKGPNSKKPSSAASSSKTTDSGDNKKAALECSKFAHDHKITSVKALNIKVDKYLYKLTARPVLLSYANLKLTKTCVHENGKWAEISAEANKNIDDSDIEVLNKVCKKLTEDNVLKTTLEATNSIISDVPDSKSFNGGFLIHVNSTADKKVLNKTYRCNHALLNIKK